MNLVNNFAINQLILLTFIGIVPFRQLPVNAQEKTSPPIKSFATSFEPPNKDKPLATRGGASRGQQCMAEVNNSEVPLIPILPAMNQRLTVASHPTFLIHIPQTSAKQVFLKIADHNEENNYQTILPISGKAGILKVTLPQDAPSLEIGKSYEWALALICEDRLQPDSPIAQGSITRVKTEINLQEQLARMTQVEQANFYAQTGIWYEAIATLATLRKEQPNNPKLISIWQEILGSVGLNAIAKAEFVD